PVTAQLVDGSLPAQTGPAPLTLTPFDGARSTYNGFMLAIFLLVSSFLASWGVHRVATRATRRAPAWDCGFPDDSPATQYTASSFGQPIRRVFGPVALRLRQQITMPPPGDTAPAEFRLSMADPVWSLFYAPLARLVEFLSGQLNILQFLTIRRYLTLMFVALVLLLIVVVLWR
ncbi:MAG: hydrogenase 4 subunit B, partial [Methylacidiphilales bacterium]|nr:hydrogenase 4 subunit B [Candidatus Methylacidiphilales bacterium]